MRLRCKQIWQQKQQTWRADIRAEAAAMAAANAANSLA
jgi:hypothetical protein